jgi:hypothetical protein
MQQRGPSTLRGCGTPQALTTGSLLLLIKPEGALTVTLASRVGVMTRRVRAGG